ncbi:MAG: acyltransferase domain-containing protein, partial [Myxococcota bacterium]
MSSFGIGGTNAHVVLGDIVIPSERTGTGTGIETETGRSELLVLSARSEAALDRMSHQLAERLDPAATAGSEHPPAGELGDVAWTLAVGRRPLPVRRTVVCRSADEARRALLGRAPERLRTRKIARSAAPVAFLFPGQGAQFPAMAGAVHAECARFRDRFEDALAAVAEIDDELAATLRRLLLRRGGDDDGAAHALADTALTQPALFVVEAALAGMWTDRGLSPVALLGHSIGELVAAHHAGVMSLADAARLVVMRGRLMAGAPSGQMVAVRAPRETVAGWLAELGDDRTVVAAHNSPTDCVVGGPAAAVAAVIERATQEAIQHRVLRTSHAFHGPLMAGAVEPFRAEVARATLSPPQIPVLSNRSGTWLTDDQATSPSYWAEHLVHPVRFAEGVATLLGETGAVLLEAGPGRSLATLVRRCAAETVVAIPSLSQAADNEQRGGRAGLLEAMSGLW